VSKFDGTIRRLGSVAGDLLRPLIAVVGGNALEWSKGEELLSMPTAGSELVFLRYPDGAGGWYAPSITPPQLEQLVAPVTERAAALLRAHTRQQVGPAQKVVLSRLAAGAVIPEHVDTNESSLLARKVHIPLVTHPQVKFHVDGVTAHLEVGSAYELNNDLPHWVENRSGIERVHLIVELLARAGE